MENKINQLSFLEQEEIRLVNEQYKIRQAEKEINQLRLEYETIYTHTQQLSDNVEETFHNSRSKGTFDELLTKLQKEQSDMLERICAEKKSLSEKRTRLEQLENEIFYQKRRLLLKIKSDPIRNMNR